MPNTGKLIILEGPDGVGKTTIAQALNNYFQARNISSDYMAFPGKKEGTLGYLVYDIHHNLQKYGVNEINSASLQLLHVAAHIDEIENRIRPVITAGHYLILDRYWWSTWVYGIVFGADKTVLRKMIELELSAWGDLRPSCAVLVNRKESFRGNEFGDNWIKIQNMYAQLVDDERGNYPIAIVKNEGKLEDAVLETIKILANHGIS